jgi:hypothetical protein
MLDYIAPAGPVPKLASLARSAKADGFVTSPDGTEVGPTRVRVSESAPALPPGLVSQDELQSGAVNDPPKQCHLLASIPALMTIVRLRNAFATLRDDSGALGGLRELAAPRLTGSDAVVLVDLEERLMLFGIFRDGYFSEYEDAVDYRGYSGWGDWRGG